MSIHKGVIFLIRQFLVCEVKAIVCLGKCGVLYQGFLTGFNARVVVA